MQNQYLFSVRKQFNYYKMLGEQTFAQLSEEELTWHFNEESNSIAIIVNHLWGNMKSRWTDFLYTDGEKEWRNREEEFEPIIQCRTMLVERWNDGWHCLFAALDQIDESNFDAEVYIRSQKHSIVEALNRQMMHYSYHIGQIVYVGRMLKREDWQSLSIPKGQSKAFNNEKQAKGKHTGHFTDDLM